MTASQGRVAQSSRATVSQNEAALAAGTSGPRPSLGSFHGSIVRTAGKRARKAATAAPAPAPSLYWAAEVGISGSDGQRLPSKLPYQKATSGRSPSARVSSSQRSK